MNVLLILLFAIAALAAGYVLLGGLLAKKWDIRTQRDTPAVRDWDELDYVPTRKGIVFSHQFASIADGGLITGTVQAAVFGWVPVLLWLVLGAVLIGGVQDVAALYTSVKNRGRTLGSVAEQYIGKWGKRIFLGFAWVCAVLVIGAFVDLLSRTYCGVGEGGTLIQSGGQVTLITLLLMVMSLFWGLVNRFGKLSRGINELIAAAILFSAVMLGMMYPVFLRATNWFLILFLYLLLSSSLPIWLMTQPRNFISTRVILLMVLMAVVGLLVGHPNMQLEPFRGFFVEGQPLFPYLFATAACGAVSGYHTIVTSATTSKIIRNEKHIVPVAYGSMLLAALTAVIVLLTVGGTFGGEALRGVNPMSVFPASVAGFLKKAGLQETVATPLVSFGVCTLVLSTLDAVARAGRMAWQELLLDSGAERQSPAIRVLTNNYAAAAITVLPAIGIALLGYEAVFPLFGNANLLIGAVSLLTCALFFKKTGRKGGLLWAPMLLLLAFALLLLGTTGWTLASSLLHGTSTRVLSDVFQLLFTAASLGIAAFVSIQTFRQMLAGEKQAK